MITFLDWIELVFIWLIVFTILGFAGFRRRR